MKEIRWPAITMAAFLIAGGKSSWAQPGAADAKAQFVESIATIFVDAPKREDGTLSPVIDRDWVIRPNVQEIAIQTVSQALRSYDAVTEEEWSSSAIPIAGSGGLTGRLFLKDGSDIRWMMPQEGLLVIRAADGRWYYLIDRKLRKQPGQVVWEPTSVRSPLLAFPTDSDRCEAAAVTRQEAQACINAHLLSMIVDTRKPIDASAPAASPSQRIPVSLAVEAAKPVFEKDEPLLLYLTLYNRMAGPIWFVGSSVVPTRWNAETKNCELTAVVRDRIPQALKGPEQAEEAAPRFLEKTPRQTINANESLTLTIDAKKWKIDGGWVAGEYQVSVAVGGMEVDERTSLRLTSGPAAFTIQQPTGVPPSPHEATLEDFINDNDESLLNLPAKMR